MQFDTGAEYLGAGQYDKDYLVPREIYSRVWYPVRFFATSPLCG